MICFFTVYEAPKPAPLICRCENGGVCLSEDKCKCEEGTEGEFCEIGKSPVNVSSGRSPAAVSVPVVLIIIVIVAAAGLYVYWRRQAGA